MVAPLIPLIAGTIAKQVGTRAVAGAAASGQSAAAGRALQFGGAALQRSAFVPRRQEQPQPQRHQRVGEAAWALSVPGMLESASERYPTLSPYQFQV